MSARQLARLRALVEEKKRQEQEQEPIEEEEDEIIEEKPRVSFSALAFSDDDEDDDEDEEESESTTEEEIINEPVEIKKKEKKVEEVDEMKYLDEIIANNEKEECDNQLNKNNNKVTDTMYIDLNDLLSVNIKKLNDEEESTHKFGNAEGNEGMGRGARLHQRQQKHIMGTLNSSLTNSIFINPTLQNVRPPSIIGGGFNFESVETPFNFDKGSLVHLDNEATFYSLNASSEYESLIEEYESLKIAYIHNDMTQLAFEFYQKHPYCLHVGYDICLMMLMYKDSDQTLFFLRQCLYIIEKALGPRFQWSSCQNRFLYSEEENKIIYNVFQLYIQMAIRKACFETALNSSLLLFSFFPQLDPMGTLLQIPYLALTSHHHQLVIHMMESGLAIGTLPLFMLPNWAFDYGLALYDNHQKTECKQQLKQALLLWPQIPKIIKQNAKNSLYVPTSISEHMGYNYETTCVPNEVLLQVFGHREITIWSTSEIWSLLLDCYKDIQKDMTEDSLNQSQLDLINQYSSLSDYFESISELTEIEDNLFTVNPEDFGDNLPEVTINDIIENAQQAQLEAQMEEQLNAMRIDGNVPADHNLVRLFFEALNPNMNVNELNDDDIAAMNEQLNEMLEGGQVNQPGNEEEAWEQDWNSDEE